MGGKKKAEDDKQAASTKQVLNDSVGKKVSGLFDDMVDDDEQDTIFGDAVILKSENTTAEKQTAQEKEKTDKESPLPSLNVSDDIDQDDPFETIEKKDKKKSKSGFFDDN